MSVWRLREKEIKAGDLVLYRPICQPITEFFLEHQAVSFGTVISADRFRTHMTITVDWDRPAVPRTVNVNDVELLRRRGATGEA